LGRRLYGFVAGEENIKKGNISSPFSMFTYELRNTTRRNRNRARQEAYYDFLSNDNDNKPSESQGVQFYFAFVTFLGLLGN
jgi:hypothetical protein